MTEPTREQIEKFVRIRNRAEFHNNLQFGIDCRAAGFNVSDLPAVVKCDDGSYQWTFSHGTMSEVGFKIDYYPGL